MIAWPYEHMSMSTAGSQSNQSFAYANMQGVCGTNSQMRPQRKLCHRGLTSFYLRVTTLIWHPAAARWDSVPPMPFPHG